MPPSCRGCNPVDARTATGRVPIDEDRRAKDAAEQIRLENLLRSSLGKAAAAKGSIRALKTIEVFGILVWPSLIPYLGRLATSSPMSCHAKKLSD
jgi:hypothetical protein